MAGWHGSSTLNNVITLAADEPLEIETAPLAPSEALPEVTDTLPQTPRQQLQTLRGGLARRGARNERAAGLASAATELQRAARLAGAASDLHRTASQVLSGRVAAREHHAA